jgi:hypothetical protein
MKLNPSSNSLEKNMNALNQALEYAARGWAVFPVHTIQNGHCSCGDDNCSSPGKHPATNNGFKSATTDTNQIQSWWSGNVEWNIGIATGHVSGLLVIDLDISDTKDGRARLMELEEANTPLDKALQVRTGSGGTHLYFAMPQMDISSSAGRPAAGIDIRANSGYVVAPPSIHISGNRYNWINS